MSYSDEVGYVYGLREIMLFDLDGSNPQKLPASQTLSFTETITADQLRGDDVIVASVAFIEGLEFTIEAGGISLDAYGKLTGEQVTESGVTPNRITELRRQGAKSFPRLLIYGRALSDGNDDIHMILLDAKLSSLEGNFGNQQFYITSAGGNSIADENNEVFVIRHYETAQPIPPTATP